MHNNLYQAIKAAVPILFLLLLQGFGAFAQQLQPTANVSIAFGSHTTFIGIQAGVTVINNYVQASLFNRFNFYYKNYNTKKWFWENKITGTLFFGVGKTYTPQLENTFITPYINTLHKPLTIGYAYNYYVDNRKTSQPTATIILNYKQFYFITENDAFAFVPFDKYRTGNMHLFYIKDSIKLGLQMQLFTGETFGGKLCKGNYGRYGIKDITGNNYGTTSVGVLNIIAQYKYAYAQLGYDSEWIRHFFQNKMIHNNTLVHALNPKVNNPAIALLDSNNKAVLNLQQQKVRNGKVFWQIGIGNY